ncbi:TPA: acetyl-CoA carboxylase biotin carboxylase subunit family protein [Vibrio cholerae]|uniref:ATP-grasp domain-containing protein n=1 Tax=Vibrio cholerae TaxID=666 RepID=UPI0022712825|nr:ATP-grasp domain-containing protein [Vibrio cholerae]MCX9439920.1 ATP-grasp domain-containing protein [Vibrio cholerae]HDI3164213.1 ATP-grasp domain-containing protein [Vibrio cholerae]
MTVLILNRGAFSFDYNNWLPEYIKEQTIIFSSKTRPFSGFKDVVYVDSIGDGEFQAKLLEVISNHEVIRIFAHSEDDFELVDSLRCSLGLRDKHLPELYQFKNKLHMKSLLLDLGVPIADYVEAKNVIDIHNFIKSKGGYPIVVKPVDGSGSVGVSIIKSEQELSTWVRNSHTFPVIVEAFIKKELYHADGIIIDGKIQFLSIGKYLSSDTGGALSMLSEGSLCSTIINRYEADSAAKIYDLVEQHLQKFARYAQKYILPFHFEFFYSKEDKNLVACEIAARIGGPRILETNSDLFGVNLHRIWLSEYFDLPWDAPENLYPASSGGWMLYKPIGTRIISGPTKCDLVEVSSSTLKFDFGQRLNEISNSADYIFGVSFRANTSDHAELVASSLLEWTNETFQIAN